MSTMKTTIPQTLAAKLAAENGHDPIAIGKSILEMAGYRVQLYGFGYNSLNIHVTDKDKTIFENVIGL